jgi:hypothetical protein
MQQLSKTDKRYEMLSNMLNVKLYFVSNRLCASHIDMPLINTKSLINTKCGFSITEYYNVIVYKFFKNGQPINEARYVNY